MADRRQKLVLHTAGEFRFVPRPACFLERFGGSLLQHFPFGDIPGNLGRADDCTVAVPDGRDRERNVNRRAIFPESASLEMFDALAPPDPFENIDFLVSQVGWKDA